MRIAIVALEGSLSSAINGFCDTLWIARQVIASRPDYAERVASTLLETQIVSADGQPVRDAQGRWLHVDGDFAQAAQANIVLVGGMALGSDRFPLHAGAVTHAAQWIKKMHQQGATVGAACAGGLVLGEAGLLDRRRCTTTWWLFPTLRERYPHARPVWGKTLEQQDNIITTGGPLSWTALTLHLLQTMLGADMTRQIADMTVADAQPLSQRLYAPPGFINTQHPLLMRAEEIIRYQNPGITAEQLASALHTSERTLHRKMKSLTGESPKTFITRVRIEGACIQLENPAVSIRKVAADCGYSDETSFRKAFSQMMEMTPLRYRQWIAARASSEIR